MKPTPLSLNGITICYVSTGAFGGVWRTWKQARTLADAGARVVIVGYEHLMPTGLADSGHEVIEVPRPQPPEPPTMPDPPRAAPDLPPAPDFPEPPEWRNSTNPLRLFRVIENRTVNRWAYEQAARPYKRAVSRYRQALQQHEQDLLGHQEELDRHAQAFSDYLEEEECYRKKTANPPPYFDWRANPVLVAAVVSTNADVVQAVDLPSLDCGWKASQELDARLIYAAHEYWAGFLNNPDYAAEPAEAQGLLALEHRLIGAADLVTVTSDQMAERLVDRYGVTTPLTILNSPPERVESSRPVSQPVRLVYHGGLSNDRNIDGLIRAIALLGDLVTLDIHGFGRTVGEDVLQGLVDELGLGDSVHLHGAFQYADVVDMLSTYDVGVMSAKVIEENFEVTLPNKIFDCMCAGLAVAMYDSSAVRGVLNQVPFGICIDPSSPESIARDLDPLVRNPQRIAKMKATAVGAAQRYWWPEQGRKLLEAIGDMLREN